MMLDGEIDGLVVRLVQASARGLFRLALGDQALGTRLHCQDSGAGMNRHVEGGDHLDLARLGGFEDIDVIGPCEMTGARRGGIRAGPQERHQATRLGRIMAAPAADRGQFRQAFDLKPPAFVIA